MSAGKIILLILGVLALVAAFVLMFGGGVLIWANSALTDGEGFFTTKEIELETNSHAIVTKPADVELRAAWIWDTSDLLTIKVEGENNDTSKDTFIGIAEEQDWKAYLNGVAYAEITEFIIYPFEVNYEPHRGNSTPEGPTSRDLWTAQAYGNGTQTLKWDLESGSYSLVLMNGDGSAGVDLSIVLGAKIPPVFGIGVGLLVGGIVALLVGSFMIYLAVRRQQTVSESSHAKRILE